MKNFFKLLSLLLCVLLLSSCGLIVITDVTPPTDPTLETAGDTDPFETAAPERYTVYFEENESFPTEAARKASERIDPAIETAVKLLNTVGGKSIQVLDCDYGARPKERDLLKNPKSIELYDDMLEKLLAFEDYRYFEKDFPGEDLFNIFVSAVDALRADRTDLFLYSDGAIKGSEYYSAYFMPGDGLSRPCTDRDAIRAEVDLCNAVVERILEKMPVGLSNYEKCCYFAFVIAAGNEYDYSDDIYLYDYPAYSALVKGKTICSGYAQAFARLCREAGVSCWYCRGTTPEGRHAWNMIDTEDGPLYLDITWYDTDELSSDYREGKEQYLFMTEEDFDYFGYLQEICQ